VGFAEFEWSVMFQSHREETSPEREERILRFWQEGKNFERSVEEKKGCPLLRWERPGNFRAFLDWRWRDAISELLQRQESGTLISSWDIIDR